MLILSQAAASSSRCCTCCTSSTSSSISSSLKFSHSNPKITLFSKPNLSYNSIKSHNRFLPILAKSSDSSITSSPSSTSPVTKQQSSSSSSSSFPNNDTVFVGQESVPLEGVIQFDKPSSSPRIQKWGYVLFFIFMSLILSVNLNWVIWF